MSLEEQPCETPSEAAITVGQGLRIGIVTVWQWICRQDNYGSLLQAYALQKTLQRFGHRPEVVRLASTQEERRRIWSPPTLYLRLRMWLAHGRKRRSYRIRLMRALHPRGFFQFACDWLTLSSWNAAGADLPPEAWKRYDALVAGSDQIWFDPEPWYFLAGEGPRRRVIYAASRPWGTPSEAFAHAFRTWAPGLTSISVREEEGVACCAALGRRSTWVADPTLLLTEAQWRAFAGTAPRRRVAYFVRDFPVAVRQMLAARVKRLGGYAAWVGVQGAEADLGSPYDTWPTPLQWVALLASAEEVVTNSFHGLCFAVLFRRPFAVLCQEDAPRQMSLLRRLGLETRRASRPEEVEAILARPIDWPAVTARLETFRTESLAFLREALEEPSTREGAL